MAEECPAACELCENAGLSPTPAPFELDYVCDGKLSTVPSNLEDVSHIPSECSFACRDNMTEICKQEAARGGCKEHVAVMRKQCPVTCGVCRALGMPNSDLIDYPKPYCKDAEEHAPACVDWAAKGECIKNFGFMAAACGASCGLCGSTEPLELAAGSGKAAGKSEKKKGKKKGKKADKGAAGSEATSATEEDPASRSTGEATVSSGGGGGSIPSGGGSIPSSAGGSIPSGSGAAASKAEAAAQEAEAPSAAAGGKADGGGDGGEGKAKGGFVTGVKKAFSKVGEAFKGKKSADPDTAKGEL